jgi:electron transfer flavoprotein beta subunit
VPWDSLAIARALAAELKDGAFDLIRFGRVATDSGNGAVGPMTAGLLGLPCVSAITALEIGDGGGTAERELEGATESVRFPLPAVLTIDEGIARARLPSLKGIMAAKKNRWKPARRAGAGVSTFIPGLHGNAAGRIIGEGPTRR